MSFERVLLVLLALASVVAWTGLYERFVPPRPHFDARDGLVLPRHERSGERVELRLEDGSAASLAVPKATRRPRPIVTLLEQGIRGARCRELEAAWERSAFVLCVPVERDLEKTSARLRAALGATKASFGDHVAKGSVILAGSGEAAEQATLLAREEPSFFRRLILIDGHRLWSSSMAAIFKKGGGERVLFVCESDACRRSEAQLLTVSRSVGLDTALEERPGWLERRRGFITAGDARFEVGR